MEIDTERTKYSAGGGRTGSRIATLTLSRSGGKFSQGFFVSPNPDQTTFDYSGLIQWACRQIGITNMPRSVAAQLSFCKKKGKIISVSEALKTRGALLFRGTDYVAVSLGNGKSVEAVSNKHGVRVMSAVHNRGWTTGALIPGVRY